MTGSRLALELRAGAVDPVQVLFAAAKIAANPLCGSDPAGQISRIAEKAEKSRPYLSS